LHEECDFDTLPTIPKQTAIYLPMLEPSADIVNAIRNLNESDDFMDFDNKYGHTESEYSKREHRTNPL
jgi:hypothetical protein